MRVAAAPASVPRFFPLGLCNAVYRCDDPQLAPGTWIATGPRQPLEANCNLSLYNIAFGGAPTDARQPPGYATRSGASYARIMSEARHESTGESRYA